MPTDIVEMLWECGSKKGCPRQLGRFKECQVCGRPKTDDCREFMPDDVSSESESVVTNPELKRRFMGGADRNCRYCESKQWKVDGTCARCGAPADEKAELKELERQSRDDGRPVPPPPRVRPIAPPRPVFREAVSVPPHDPLPRFRPGFSPGAAVIVLGGSLALGGLIYAACHVERHPATVTAASWTYVVHVQKRIVASDDGWSVPPGAFNIVNEGSRIRTYNRVLDHYDIEHYTERESCGKGTTKWCNVPRTRQVPVYRNDPVYDTHWRWDEYRWVFSRDVQSSGADTNPRAPTLEELGLGEWERVTSDHELTCSVTFTDDDGQRMVRQYRPRSCTGELQKLAVGTKHTIEVGTMGGVSLEQRP